MPEISVSEFREHIEEDDFPLRYGNPVVINSDNGKKLVCLSWEFYERLMKLSGRGDELDKINRQIADKSVD
jgi:PHD/YefM family antitoxin component YafN of YafNO toxin-antitoxin module